MAYRIVINLSELLDLKASTDIYSNVVSYVSKKVGLAGTVGMSLEDVSNPVELPKVLLRYGHLPEFKEAVEEYLHKQASGMGNSIAERLREAMRKASEELSEPETDAVN